MKDCTHPPYSGIQAIASAIFISTVSTADIVQCCWVLLGGFLQHHFELIFQRREVLYFQEVSENGSRAYSTIIGRRPTISISYNADPLIDCILVGAYL